MSFYCGGGIARALFDRVLAFSASEVFNVTLMRPTASRELIKTVFIIINFICMGLMIYPQSTNRVSTVEVDLTLVC